MVFTSKSTFTGRATRLAALAFILALAAPVPAADSFEARLQKQLEKIGVTQEQAEPFRERLAEFYSRRNGALRRIGRQGGDLTKRVSRDLRREGGKAVEAMAEVLTEDQLAHYEKFVKIACDQYMAVAGLK